MLTDTVGFIDRLPLALIEAFRYTLEETVFADLILLVVDVGEPQKEIERKLSCCLDTIVRIGAGGSPIVTALNKIDLLRQTEVQLKVEALRGIASDPVPVSALHGINLTLLEREIRKHLKDYTRASLSLPVTDGSMSFLSWLFSRADVRNIKYNGDTVSIVFEAVPWFVDMAKGRAKELCAFSGLT